MDSPPPVSQGWGSKTTRRRDRDISHSPVASSSHSINKPTRKSAFSKTRFEIDDDSNEDIKSPRRSSAASSGGKLRNVEKSHTIIEIDKQLPRKSSRTARPSNKRREGFENSSSEDDSNGHFEASDIEESDRKKSLVIQTTSALLLAEEELLGSQLLTNGSGKNYWNCVEFSNPVHTTQEQWNEWKTLTFIPSIGPVVKSPEDIENQIAEDEGVFLGEPVGMSKRNWNLLDWRIISENAKNIWIGSDRKIFSYPDPYRSELIQLFQDEEIPNILKSLQFIPARLDPLQDFRSGSGSEHEFEIDLGYVNFLHHPYFSKEHVIAATLLNSYETYATRRIHKVTDRTINKLRALREAVAYTRNSIVGIEDARGIETDEDKQMQLKETLSQHKERLNGYRHEIRKCTLARDQGFWDDKTTLTAVVSSWKDLKHVREQQGYSNTSLKLNILELPSDANEEMEIWMQDVEDDLQGIEEECEEIFELEMSKYRAKMKKWTDGKRRKEVQAKGSGDFSNVDDDSDVSSSNARRPKPPVKRDSGDFRKRLEKRYKEIRRRPGEPNVILELVKTASITSTKQLPEEAFKERERRKIMRKCKVEIHLWLNGNEIYTSKQRNINSDFSVFLGFKVPLCIHEAPELLEIQITEPETKIKTLRIPISLPEKITSIDRSQMRHVMFFADDIVRPPNGAVGCGVDFEINGNDYEGRFTKGNITIRCGWSPYKEKSGETDLQEEKSFRNQNLNFTGDPSRKLSQTSEIDPNDPRNAFRHAEDENAIVSSRDIVAIRHSIDDSHKREDKRGFQLDQMMNEFDFCNMEFIDKSFRFRLLQLRDEGVPEFKNVKMISPFERDITSEMFLAYERRLKEDLRKRMGGKSLANIGRKKHHDEDSVYESNRLEKIREMRLSVLQLFEKSLKQITFEDLVIEEQIPDIGTLGLNLMAFFQPRRPLRPIRKERKRIQASNLVDTKIDVIFNVVRAFNLPLRKDSDVGLITTESLTGVQLLKKRTDRAGNYSTVRPFVEIWFQRKKIRTTTALGSNPTWNQELQLNLAVPNDDFSQSNLSKMDDTIFLLMYDEVAVDLLEDERRRETDIYQRTERRWLGSISIPFSTLYTNGRIEGTFKLNMPQVLLGYEPQGIATHFGGIGPKGYLSTNPSSAANIATATAGSKSGVGGVGVPFSSQTNAFLTIFITLQPAVQPSISYKEDNASGESGDMMAYVKSWKNSFERRFPERIVRPFVMTADGDTILCTRYLTSIQPPEQFLSSSNGDDDRDRDLIHTMEMLGHYVSLFPFVRDSTLGITDYSLWFTSEVFVATPGGGVDDHAVLLACYFLHLNVPCWIVQGNSIPDGPTTFVVTSFKGMGEDKGISKSLKNATLLWNPCTGEYFNAHDNFCPLQKVWCAIGKQNIWANVSEGERPHQLDWNIGKSKSWLPLFNRGIAEDKIPCVQLGFKRYKDADQVQANSLAQRIERNLKDAFMKWRSTSKTNWNRYCSATLRRLLPKLEDVKSGRSKPLELPGSGSIESAVSVHTGSLVNINDEHLIELREIMTSYQMSGFPLQQPYVNMHSIMETVYATGVHTIDTPDVEFALAAYAHAYPASVYSVWVYVATLHRRK